MDMALYVNEDTVFIVCLLKQSMQHSMNSRVIRTISTDIFIIEFVVPPK